MATFAKALAPSLVCPQRIALAGPRVAVWRLLTPGDEVSIAGDGAYELVHVDSAKAWLTSLADGSHLLVSAACLRLRHPARAAYHLI